MVVDALNEHGWQVEKPKATMYVWAPVPEKFKGDSGAFATALLDEAGVMITPGRAFGEWGEGFFRISLTYPDDVLREAMDRIMGVSV
jgi:LL-diaminopimelate aminotransferase